MTVDDDFVIVQRSLFDCLRQHCEHCHEFGEQLQDLSDGRVVVVPYTKRKIPLESGPQGPNGARKRLRPSEATLKWFLRNIPNATEWRKRQVELGLKTVEQYEGIVRAFGNGGNIGGETSQGDGHSNNALVRLAERFALFTKHSLEHAELQRSVALFQALILLSYCAILRTKDVPYETVDGIIRHIAAQESDRKKLLDSALWINGIINQLVGHGWTIFRATELFFIGMFPNPSLRRSRLIALSDALSLSYLTGIRNKGNAESILEYLTSEQFVRYDYGDCLGPEYTIPGLIASLLHGYNITADTLSYGFRSVKKGKTDGARFDEICAALGYRANLVPKSIERLYKVHATSKSQTAAPTDLGFEILVPSSFHSSGRRTSGEISRASFRS